MEMKFKLRYWQDGDWYVGQLLEVPSVFSQGKSIEELKAAIKDAYFLMFPKDEYPVSMDQVHETTIEVSR